MKLQTAAEAISFAKQLENESANFYQDLSQKCDQDKDIFLSFAKENGKNITEIERAYYGVITDAIEGCFAFSVEADDYRLETALADRDSYSIAINKAIEVEEMLVKFYSEAAEQSKGLMADVPRVFRIIAKRRNNRISKLRSLVENRG